MHESDVINQKVFNTILNTFINLHFDVSWYILKKILLHFFNSGFIFETKYD